MEVALVCQDTKQTPKSNADSIGLAGARDREVRVDEMPPNRQDERTVAAMHGTPPGTLADDFDLCFRFVLPGRCDIMREDADEEERPEVAEELRKLAQEDEEGLEKQNEVFVANLAERMKQREMWKYYTQCLDHSYVHQPFVEKLFRDFFVEKADTDRFVCPEIHSITDARKLCIDLILSMVRGNTNQYYSYVFSSLDRTELLLCVKMGHEAAKRHAEASNYALQLTMEAVTDPSKLNIGLSLGREGEDGPSMQAAYAPFKMEMHDFFQDMQEIDSIRLVYDRITDVLDIEAMKKWGLMMDYFPLHSPEVSQNLNRRWGRPSLWWSYDQPIREVRNYFGENIAMYFVFVEFVCRWTRVLAVTGVLLTILDLVAGGSVEMSRKGILSVLGAMHGLAMGRKVFALVLVTWCLLFSICLTRKCWRCYSIWGTDLGSVTNSSVKAEYNPRFAKSARMIQSEIDVRMVVLEVPYRTRRIGQALSNIGSIMFILVASTAIFGIIKCQAFFAASGNQAAADMISYSMIIPIRVLNSLSGYVCPILADYEHHKNRLDYDNAIANKMFYVQFINTFCTFYYIAFFMKPWGDTTYVRFGGTWLYLSYLMCITFLLYLVFVVFAICQPLFDLAAAMRNEYESLKRRGKIDGTGDTRGWCSRVLAKVCGCCSCKFMKLELSFLELQSRMDPYTGEDRNQDHMQILLPLGFVVAFGATLPLSAGLALACFGLRLRVDAWKLTKAMRRPFPTSLEPGHWIWLRLVKNLMWIAIITNIGLVCFAMDPFDQWSFVNQSLLFFVLCLAAVVISTIIVAFVPEVPADVVLAVERHRRQRELLRYMSDDRKYGQEHGTNPAKHILTGRCDQDFSKIGVCELEEPHGRLSFCLGIQSSTPLAFRHTTSLA